MDKEIIIKEIMAGKAGASLHLVQKAVKEGFDSVRILDEILNESLERACENLKAGSIFAPEILIITFAYDTILQYLKPILPNDCQYPDGKELVKALLGQDQLVEGES